MTQRFTYPSGSEWNKWDLHIHTPLSVVNGYGGNTEEAWENFIQDLEKMDPDIKVIGINDYWFLDGYKKVSEYKEAGRLQNIEAIFPVVEFRINNFAGTDGNLERVNYHVIFSDELDPEVIEQQFLNSIAGKFNLSGEHSGITWSGTMTRAALTDLGKAVQASVPAERQADYSNHLQEGFNALVIDFKKATDILEERVNYFQGKYLTAVGKTEWSAIRWNDQSVAAKKTLINNADFVFVASESPEACIDTKSKLHEDKVNSRLLDCSDAHYFSHNEAVKDRIGNCFTWIKSNPTFQGLKEVRIEPDLRVHFSNTHPLEKKPYQYIRRVRFIDQQETDRFPTEAIELNSDLVTIIGGKSTGKSLLLYHIAASIDPAETSQREAGAYFDEEFDFNFEVEWADGHKDLLRDSEKTELRKIVYIPQKYLNNRTEGSSAHSINEMIVKVLKQDPATANMYESHNSRLQATGRSIIGSIESTLGSMRQLEILESELKDLGDEGGVNKNITNIKKQITDLSRTAGLKPEEIAALEELTEQQSKVTSQISDLKQEGRTAKMISQEVLDGLSEISSKLMEQTEHVEIGVLQGALKAIVVEISKLQEGAAKRFEKVKSEQLGSLEKLAEQSKTLTEKIKPFHGKVKAKDKVEKLRISLEAETKRLASIQTMMKQATQARSEIEKNKQGLLSGYAQLFSSYEALRNYLKEKEEQLGDISFNLKLSFNEEAFTERAIETHLNKKTVKTVLSADHGAEFNYSYSHANHPKNIKVLIKGIFSGEVSLLKGSTLREALQNLLTDYYRLDFEITYKGDTLKNMSPGKRSLVVLKLLMDLNHEEWPILLDQPEDDLDNRSIYSELATVLRDKKSHRQIIVVTHNPNLVVGADSDVVVVCNQKGQEEDRDNRSKRFEYVTGAIENTFEEPAEDGVLYQKGIREHVCEVLEGGTEAFAKREKRYGAS